MTEASQRLLDAALQLPAYERQELFERLGDSLAPSDTEESDRAWREEIHARLARIDAGTAQYVDLEEVERELLREQADDERTSATSG
jgi:putative addiction module component (TIGR02574 family)